MSFSSQIWRKNTSSVCFCLNVRHSFNTLINYCGLLTDMTILCIDSRDINYLKILHLHPPSINKYQCRHRRNMSKISGFSPSVAIFPHNPVKSSKLVTFMYYYFLITGLNSFLTQLGTVVS